MSPFFLKRRNGNDEDSVTPDSTVQSESLEVSQQWTNAPTGTDFLSNLIDHIAMPAFIIHGDGTIATVNETAVEKLGIPADYVTGVRFHELLHPDSVGVAHEMVESLARNKSYHSSQILLKSRENITLAKSIRAGTIDSERGLSTRYIVLCEDDTGKYVENANQEANHSNSMDIFDLVNAVLLIVNGKGVIETFNKAAGELFQSETHPELMGTSFVERIHEDDQDRVRYQMQLLKIQSPPKGRQFEIRVKGNEGLVHEMIASMSSMPGSDDRIMTVLVDITRVKRAEKDLRHSVNHYKSLFDFASDLIFIHDFNGVILEVNQSMALRLGYDKDELIGRSIQDLIADGESSPVDEYLIQLQSVETLKAEVTCFAGNGSRFPVELNSRVISYGHEKAILCVARDIAEKKSSEKALHRRLEEHMVLQEVANAGSEATGLDELIERATQIIGTTWFPDSFGIGLIDDVTGRVYLHPSYRGIRSKKEGTVALSNGLTSRVVSTGNTMRIMDMSLDSDYADVVPLVRSALYVPLNAGKRVIGVIIAESKRLGAFSESDERLMNVLAGQLATAMEKIRLRQSELQRVRELEALRETMTGILAELGGSKSLSVVVERATELLRASSGELGLYDDTDKSILIVVSHKTGFDSAGTVLQIGEGALGSVVKTGKPLIIHNYQSWNGRSNHHPDAPWHAVLSAPLSAGSELIGAISLGDKNRERVFTQSDLRLLTLFAQQAAMAVKNARLFKEIQQLAITDSLTSLYNRRHFFEMANREVARAKRYKKPLSVLMIDIDDFKNVNDTHGHATGDEVLKGVSECFRNSLREIDLKGRYGGEEFALVLPDTGLENARRVAEQLRYKISKLSFFTTIVKLNVTVSIGISSLSEDEDDFRGIIKRADSALYEAKTAGKNRVFAYGD